MRLLPDAREGARQWVRWARENPLRVRALATLVILVLVASSFLAPFVMKSDTRHLSAFSQTPRDLSRFYDELEAHALARGSPAPRALATSPHFLESLRAPEEHALFVVGVERPYTEGEAAAILRFVEAGGTLVLANDVTNGNRLTVELGIGFGEKTVLDRASNYNGDPRIVQATFPVGDDRYRVLLNEPGYVHVQSTDTVQVLAATSGDSFIDVDGNGRIEVPPDTAGASNLLVETRHGAGRVLVIADTGIFMNEMLAVPGYDNAAYARALIASVVPPGGSAIVDESRHAAPPSSQAGGAALRLVVLATTTPAWRVGVAAVAIFAAVATTVLTRGTEDWSLHVFDVGHERRAPDGLAPTPERLRALAARAVSERYNIPLEYLDSAALEEIVRLTGDRELAAVATGASRAVDPRTVYPKLIDQVPIDVPLEEAQN